MRKYTLPFHETKGIIPIVEVGMGDGKRFYAIVDTGSESTLIDKRFKKTFPGVVKSHKVVGKTNYHGISGEVETVLVEAVIQLPMKTVDGEAEPLEMKCFVNDLSSLSAHYKKIYGFDGEFMMLLGSDVMRQLGAVIDLGKDRLTLKVKENRKKKQICLEQ